MMGSVVGRGSFLVVLLALASLPGLVAVNKRSAHYDRHPKTVAPYMPAGLPAMNASMPARWLEEDSSPPPGISSEHMALLREFYDGVNPGHPDRLVLEVMDLRVDDGATALMATAVATYIGKIKEMGTEKGSMYYMNRACNFRIPKQYDQDACFKECSPDDDLGSMAGVGSADASLDFCYKGKASTGGSLITSVALSALDPEKHGYAITTFKHIMALNNHHVFDPKVGYEVHVATGWKVDEGADVQNAFKEVTEMRKLRADAIILQRCEMLGEECTAFKASTSLAYTDHQNRFKSICTECVVAATQRLQALRENSDPSELEGVAIEFEKWSHALRCATHEGFPDCLPMDVYKQYQCRIEADPAADCAPQDLEEGNTIFGFCSNHIAGYVRHDASASTAGASASKELDGPCSWWTTENEGANRCKQKSCKSTLLDPNKYGNCWDMSCEFEIELILKYENQVMFEKEMDEAYSGNVTKDGILKSTLYYNTRGDEYGYTPLRFGKPFEGQAGSPTGGFVTTEYSPNHPMHFQVGCDKACNTNSAASFFLGVTYRKACEKTAKAVYSKDWDDMQKELAGVRQRLSGVRGLPEMMDELDDKMNHPNLAFMKARWKDAKEILKLTKEAAAIPAQRAAAKAFIYIVFLTAIAATAGPGP